MKKVEWTRIFDPRKDFIAKAALAVCVFFLPLRILTAHGMMPGIVLEKFGLMEVRADFGPVYLLNFAAVAYGLAWLLIAGPRHENATIRTIASTLTGLFSLSYLQLLGRHSLQIYVWHVLIVYGVFYIDGRFGEFSNVTKTVITFGSLALLCLPALWRERNRTPAPSPAKRAPAQLAPTMKVAT